MRSAAHFSPSKQSRYEKSNGPFVTFHTTNQLNKGQLADFRKEVRNNVSQREPFMPHNEKINTIFTSWKKPEKRVSETSSLSKLYANRSSPKKSRVPGGLNMEEIFQKKHIDTSQGSSFYVSKQMKIESLFKKSPQKSSQPQNNSFTNILPAKKNTPQVVNTFASRLSGYNDSPQRAQLKLDRFKSWDQKLDVQLRLQNNSIGRKLTPTKEPRSYQRYAQQKENFLDNLRPLSTKEQLLNHQSKFFSRANTPPLASQRYVEKVPLTDIVRMTSHFSQLSSQEVATISKGYISELNNLQSALQRVVKQASGSFGF